MNCVKITTEMIKLQILAGFAENENIMKYILLFLLIANLAGAQEIWLVTEDDTIFMSYIDTIEFKASIPDTIPVDSSEYKALLAHKSELITKWDKYKWCEIYLVACGTTWTSLDALTLAWLEYQIEQYESTPQELMMRRHHPEYGYYYDPITDEQANDWEFYDFYNGEPAMVWDPVISFEGFMNYLIENR